MRLRAEQREEMMEHFTGKLAVVTGGSTGMGRELTRQLAGPAAAAAAVQRGLTAA